MKQYNPMRADVRPIEEKAFALLMAMNDDQAKALLSKLQWMATAQTAGGARARMFCEAEK